MVELHTRHTAINLRDELYSVLTEHGIDLNQIYSITIDNGRNMVKMTQLVEKDTLEDECIEEDNEDSQSSEDETEDDIVEALLDDLQDVVGHQSVAIRCGAHTTQLVVSDACKQHQKVIKAATKVVNTMRNTRFNNFFELSGAKKPPVPPPTRWNNVYNMMKSLSNQKDIFIKLGEEFEELSEYLPTGQYLWSINTSAFFIFFPDLDQYWDFIDSYVEAFEPLYDCTVAIQKVSCTLSDFYCHWMTAFGRVS